MANPRPQFSIKTAVLYSDGRHQGDSFNSVGGGEVVQTQRKTHRSTNDTSNHSKILNFSYIVRDPEEDERNAYIISWQKSMIKTPTFTNYMYI